MASIEVALTAARLKPELHDKFVAASELTTTAELKHVDAADIVEVLIEIGCPKIKAKAVAGLLKKFAASSAAGGVPDAPAADRGVAAASPPTPPADAASASAAQSPRGVIAAIAAKGQSIEEQHMELVETATAWTKTFAFANAETLLRYVLHANPRHTVAFRHYHDLLFAHVLREKGIAVAPAELRVALQSYWRERATAPAATALDLVLHGYFLRRGEKDAAGAERCFRAAIVLDPSFAPAHYHLGRVVLKAHGNWALATECLREAIRLDPEDALSHNHLGHLYFEADSFDAAEACYRRALDIDPNHSHAHNNLGLLLETARNDVAGAEDHFRKALAIDSNDVVAHYNLGKLLHRATLDVKALAHLSNEERAARLATLDVEAEASFRSAIAIDPRDALAHNNLAFLLHNARADLEGARVEYQAAIDIDPSDTCFLFNLGHLLLHDLKLYSEAIATYEAILALEPRSISATKLLEQAKAGRS